MSTNNDVTFKLINEYENGQILSSDLSKKTTKGTFGCCILRFLGCLVGAKYEDPAEYRMLQVAQNIKSFVTKEGAFLASKSKTDRATFGQKLEDLKAKFGKKKDATGRAAVQALADAIGQLGKVKGLKKSKKAGSGKTKASSIVPKQVQVLSTSNPSSSSHTPVTPSTVAKPAARPSAPSAVQLLANVVNGLRAGSQTPASVQVVPITANVQRFDQLNTATQHDRALVRAPSAAPMRKVTLPNGMVIMRVYEPKPLKKTEEVAGNLTKGGTAVGQHLNAQLEAMGRDVVQPTYVVQQS